LRDVRRLGGTERRGESELTRWGEWRERGGEGLTAEVDGLWVSNPIKLDIEVIENE